MAVEDHLMVWAHAIHVQDKNGVSGSWLSSHLYLTVVANLGMSQHTENLF